MDASCPFIDKIFSQLVDDPTHLYELAAYCLYRAYPYQKWFFLYGTGGNGKTVYSVILERLLGKENIASITPHHFHDNRFAAADLYGKFANLAGETQYKMLENTEILKQLVGSDLLRAERKYRNPFHFTNFSKMIFSTNELPKTKDKTTAFYRRLSLIEFPNKFEGTQRQDLLLLQKITVREIEGLAFKCLGYLKCLHARGFFFKNDHATDDLARKYEELTNPLDTFLNERTEEDIEGTISKGEFRDQFTQWLKKNRLRGWNETQLGKEMKRLEYEEGRPTIDGKTVRAWQGIIWK